MTVEGNGIYDNQGDGILLQGEATVSSNDIFANHSIAVRMAGEKAKVKVCIVTLLLI